jgi:hypothetical protein
MKKNRLVLIASVMFLVLVPLSARAQFRGDVFFAQPSVSVPVGGVAVMEVQMFSGSDIVGATHIDIVFDPAKAEVVAVEPGTTPELADGLASAASSGRVGVVTLNGKSLVQPLGTVSLAKLRVKPLVAAGNKVTLTIQVHSLLRQDNTAFPNSQGFSGEILVVSTATSAPLKSDSGVSPASVQGEDDAAERARAFRRPGLAVDLLDFESRGGVINVKTRQVIIPDSAAPAETGNPQRRQ